MQLQMDNNPTNTMHPRHVDCIAHHPTDGTAQGTYYFMDLHTGERRHGRQWTKCAMAAGCYCHDGGIWLCTKTIHHA